MNIKQRIEKLEEIAPAEDNDAVKQGYIDRAQAKLAEILERRLEDERRRMN